MYATLLGATFEHWTTTDRRFVTSMVPRKSLETMTTLEVALSAPASAAAAFGRSTAEVTAESDQQAKT